MVGRILRRAPGKTDALILDHSGAVFLHGFPDDEIAWTLHEDKRAENLSHAKRSTGPHGPALTTCPECSAIRLEGEPCTRCGWHPVRKAEPVEIADGEPPMGLRTVSLASIISNSACHSASSLGTSSSRSSLVLRPAFQPECGNRPPRAQ